MLVRDGLLQCLPPESYTEESHIRMPSFVLGETWARNPASKYRFQLRMSWDTLTVESTRTREEIPLDFARFRHVYLDEVYFFRTEGDF